LESDKAHDFDMVSAKLKECDRLSGMNWNSAAVSGVDVAGSFLNVYL